MATETAAKKATSPIVLIWFDTLRRSTRSANCYAGPFSPRPRRAFSFNPRGDLAFHVSWRQGPFGDGDVGSYGSLDSGNGESISKYSPGGLLLYTWSPTNDTVLAISPPPVPEPSRAALAGLLALGLARRLLGRRRQPITA